MRDIDYLIHNIKEDSAIKPIHKLYLIERIERPPTREDVERIRNKHQFKASLVDDSECLCGEGWDTKVHN